MEHVKNRLDRGLYWIVVVLFALLLIEVVWQVFTREVLGNPATWTNEGARITFVWLGLFAAAFVFGERGHFAVEVLVRKLPMRAERGIAVAVQILVLAFAAIVLLWGGLRAAVNAWTQQLTTLPFTFGQIYLALPVCGVLVAFYSLYYLLGIAGGATGPYVNVGEEQED